MKDKDIKNGSFWIGVALIGCGLVDAAFDPFAFITAPKLIGSGIAMIAVSRGKDPKEGN